MEDSARMHAEHMNVCAEYERRLRDVRTKLDELNARTCAGDVNDWYVANDVPVAPFVHVHSDTRVYNMEGIDVPIPASTDSFHSVGSNTLSARIGNVLSKYVKSDASPLQQFVTHTQAVSSGSTIVYPEVPLFSGFGLAAGGSGAPNVAGVRRGVGGDGVPIPSGISPADGGIK